MAMGDDTKSPEDGSCGGCQSYPTQGHARLTVIHVYPQQGTDSDRSPPIEGRSKQNGETRDDAFQ